VQQIALIVRYCQKKIKPLISNPHPHHQNRCVLATCSEPVAQPKIMFGRGSQWRRLRSDCFYRLFSNSWKLI